MRGSASSPSRILHILTFQLPRQASIAARADLFWGFLHPSILCLTGNKHSRGAQGTFCCDGWVMVRVFPMICHLFQVTLIKKPHLVWHSRKLKLLLIEHIKSIFILENEHLPHKAERIIITTELSSCVISLKVLYLLLKVHNLSTHLTGNTTQKTSEIL